MKLVALAPLLEATPVNEGMTFGCYFFLHNHSMAYRHVAGLEIYL